MGWRAETAEPAPSRDGASYDVWLRNLRAARADVLFVAALEPMAARTIAIDAEQFPVERTWADAHPDLHIEVAPPLRAKLSHRIGNFPMKPPRRT